MMVFVDADIAFRRALELDAGRSAAILSTSKLPPSRRCNSTATGRDSRLRHVADHGLLTPHLLERGNELLVVRIVERLEVLHAGIGAGDVLAADAVESRPR
jgi:hypothetical protein